MPKHKILSYAHNFFADLSNKLRNRRSAPTTTGRGQVVLHIGRNKAGSTTIQDMCLALRPRLLDYHVSYTMFGHLAHSQPNMPGFVTFEELSDYACDHPEYIHLVSNEFLFGWPLEFTEAAMVALAACNVKITAYIRPYDAWIISAYAEETKRGMNNRDFDEYLDWMQPRISAWPYLEKWGSCFGWENLQLYDLNHLSFHQNDLCADFLATLGIPPLPWEAPASNVSPHWIELELARRLTARNGDVEWAGIDQEELEPLLRLIAPLARDEPKIPYLSSVQSRNLITLYNEDLSRLEEAGGYHLPRLAPSSQPGAKRSAAPALSHAPPSVMNAFFKQAAAPDFAAQFPRAARRANALGIEMGFMHGKADYLGVIPKSRP